MRSKMPRVLLWNLYGPALLVRWRSGVIYQNQVGGNVCYQEEQEGVLVPLDISDAHTEAIMAHHFPTGCQGIEPAAADLIDAILAANRSTEFITVDRTRLAESWEAWVHVNFGRVPDEYELNPERPLEYLGEIYGFPPGRGVLTWANSD